MRHRRIPETAGAMVSVADIAHAPAVGAVRVRAPSLGVKATGTVETEVEASTNRRAHERAPDTFHSWLAPVVQRTLPTDARSGRDVLEPEQSHMGGQQQSEAGLLRGRRAGCDQDTEQLAA